MLFLSYFVFIFVYSLKLLPHAYFCFILLDLFTGRLVRIYWAAALRDVHRGGADWEHAKWVWRCSALVGATASEHLMANHLIFSNVASTAATEHLPVAHPMRRLMRPFSYGTVGVNRGGWARRRPSGARALCACMRACLRAVGGGCMGRAYGSA